MVASERRNPYLTPRLYVEGFESNEYLVEQEPGVFVVSRECKPGSRCFGKALYGVLLEELVDLVEKRVKRSFIVEPGDSKGEAFLVEEGSYIEPIPVSGSRAVLEVLEGDKVEEGNVLGIVVTRKYELRKIRSHVKGIVVYIYSAPTGPPDENIVFISPEESVKKVRIVGRR